MRRIKISGRIDSGKFAIVDDDDYEQLNSFSWCICGSGYAKGCVNDIGSPRRLVLMHRYITNCPKGMQVDHVNGDKLDNRKCNLRICTPSQNSANRGVQNNSKTGIKGVTLHANRYRATIRKKNKSYYLGRFDTVEECSLAYNEGAKKLFGEFAKLNTIGDENE